MFDTSDTVLFLDDEPIALTARLKRVYEQPKKFGPVLVADRPWEHFTTIVYGSVLPDPGGDGYRMWYYTYCQPKGKQKVSYLCYAVSDNGSEWEKPSVGQYEYEGSRENNILVVGNWEGSPGTLTVIYDDRDERDDRRYKMLFSGSRDPWGAGLYAAFSPDGIRWTARTEPVCRDASDRTTLLYDPDREFPYVAFTRRHNRLMQEQFRSRVIYRTESRDFLTWTDLEAILVPDLEDSWDVQFYGMPAFKYRNLYMGGLKRLWSTPDRIDTELVVSRDLRTWKRSRTAFLPNGEGDVWDSKWIGLASSPPIEKDGVLWFFHEGRCHAHYRMAPFPRGSIGVAAMLKDHFAALESGGVEGFVVTKPFLWEGGRLAFCAEARAAGGTTDHYVLGGSLRIEILDADGGPMPGYTREESYPLTTGADEWEPTWTGGATLDALAGRTIAVKAYLAHTRLYAMRRLQG